MTTLSIIVRLRFWVRGQARGSWSAHGPPWVWLSTLWLIYDALVFVCLMQSLSYMLWMKILFIDSLTSDHFTIIINYMHGGFTLWSSWTPREIEKIYFLHKASPKWVKILSIFFSWAGIHGIYDIVKNGNQIWRFVLS